MADSFLLSGSYTTTPLGGTPSFAPNIDALIDEPAQLEKKQVADIDLTVDTEVAIAFGGVTNANIVILKAVGGGTVTARITSSKGANQDIPFDTYLILMSMNAPVTAIGLVRTPATLTTVRVFLGEES